jgi:lipopolysaccharide/colanic/teichoic acid biosynthesis glycosyltransferase
VRAKRVFDFVASCAAIVVASPVLAVAAILVKATSPGPVFHRAVRIGRDGQPFTLLKFRTMRVSGDASIGLTASGDPRVTAVGAILRRLKVDELPQLFNVISGDMSLVGPRPEDPRYVDGYTDEQRRLLSVRPGITSPASVAFRHEEQLLGAHEGDRAAFYREHILPQKLALDLAHLDRQSFWSDVGVLLRTGLAIFRPAR